MKFKSNIEVQAGIEDKDGQVGSSGQILASTGSQVDWIDPANIVTSATDVIIECKNTSGVTIAKGTPVYQTGNVGATAVIEVAVADASDEDKMAAIGLLQSDLINNAFGYVVVTGELLNITTSPIDGVTPTIGDTIYVKPGGGLTLTKPTGVNFIQNVGLVGKVSGGNAGSLTVSSIMRSNDVPTPLYIDHDNQRLGIGTTSPSRLLDVDGIQGWSEGTNVEKAYLNPTGTGTDFNLLGDNGDIRFDSRAGSNSYINTGNVGIGTTNPAAISTGAPALTLNGTNTSIGAGLIFQVNGTTKSYQYVEANILRHQAVAGVSQSFWTNSSEKMRIDTSGNVGIGTTNPIQKLHLHNSATLTPTYQKFTNGTATTGTGLGIDADGDFLINNGEAKQIKLYTNDSQRVTIQSGGNVGIGTASPSQKLHVNAGTTNTVALFESTDATSRIVLKDNSGEGHVAAIGNNITFATSSSSSERMRITSSGNVGIGTTSPVAALNIGNNGNIRIDGNTSGGGIYASSNGSNNTFSLTRQDGVNVGDLSISGYSGVGITGGRSSSPATSGYSFYVKSDGNVGIGTTSPAYKLSVSGGIEAGGVVTYSKVAGSLDTTGYAVAGLTAGFNGASAGFEFKCYGSNSKYQRVVYSCHCGGTTWAPGKVIDEGTNDLDVVASANGATITFTFKARSSTQNYSPRIVVQATGHSINSTYA